MPERRPRDVSLEYRLPEPGAARRSSGLVAQQPPLLRGLGDRAKARRAVGEHWRPAGTAPLIRHRAHSHDHHVATLGPTPEGYEPDWALGAVQVYHQPGTVRLIDRGGDERHVLTDEQDDLGERVRHLGYLERLPFADLEPLYRATLGDTGEEVLIAGERDPLRPYATSTEHLGYVQAYPQNPVRARDERALWGAVALYRHPSERGRWRHRYGTRRPPSPDAVALGALWTAPAPGTVALDETAGGRLETESVSGGATPPRPADRARWVLAPLWWPEVSRFPSLRASASRSRAQLREALHVARAAGGGRRLGYLDERPSPGSLPLFSATHPALGDQFVTRSELEAIDLGYRVDGVLGYIRDLPGSHAGGPAVVLWGHRFGRGRRRIEGFVPR